MKLLNYLLSFLVSSKSSSNSTKVVPSWYYEDSVKLGYKTPVVNANVIKVDFIKKRRLA